MLAVLAALACGALPRTSAHGWLAVPAARNLLHLGQQGFWQQMSLNRWAPARSTRVHLASESHWE